MTDIMADKIVDLLEMVLFAVVFMYIGAMIYRHRSRRHPHA